MSRSARYVKSKKYRNTLQTATDARCSQARQDWNGCGRGRGLCRAQHSGSCRQRAGQPTGARRRGQTHMDGDHDDMQPDRRGSEDFNADSLAAECQTEDSRRRLPLSFPPLVLGLISTSVKGWDEQQQRQQQGREPNAGVWLVLIDCQHVRTSFQGRYLGRTSIGPDKTTNIHTALTQAPANGQWTIWQQESKNMRSGGWRRSTFSPPFAASYEKKWGSG